MKTEVMPVRRNLEFNLPESRIGDWHADGVHVSHFFNAMSLFFPDGERFFIDSVRAYRDEIHDPELKEAVRGFIGQEAMHGREHEEYNEALEKRGMPANRNSRMILGLLNFTRKIESRAGQLAITIALEHLTAILADVVLREPRVLEGAEPRFAALWRWHAMEETEHKAVAFDVYQATVGKGPVASFRRCFALLMATLIFWIMVIPIHIDMVRREGKLFSLSGWWGAMKFLWGKPGALRRVIPDWLDFFKPGFHPWDHDNRRFLDGVDDLVQEVEGYGEMAGVRS
ncbi:MULTISPECIES: metal-dependent hydrolase [Spongiibacter]|uniref:metal-dependent hydrolase n=1 Tax=Spongiibacter TaxID=630749 RepID=UPI000C50E0B9|nr:MULTISPECIES: metal-dependent hydrolase [Spongiibacter]MAY40164.1 metal-dependent hydrolase [Spongiibacter sp.]|tara:strand:+ start:8819 stop:9673 length:855 start_codon:yes stop_codon:yes gene_type:complete